MSGTSWVYRLIALLGLVLAAVTARAEDIGPAHIEYDNDDGAHITIDTIAVDSEEEYLALESGLQPEMRAAQAAGDIVTVTVDGRPRGPFRRWLDRHVFDPIADRARSTVEGSPFLQKHSNKFFTIIRGAGVFSLTIAGMAGTPNELWQSVALGAVGGGMSASLQALNPQVIKYINGDYNIPIWGLRAKTRGGMLRRWMMLQFLYMGTMAATGMAISAPSAAPSFSAWLAQSVVSAGISGWSQGSFDIMNAEYSKVRDLLFPTETKWNEFVINVRTAFISVVSMSLAINQISDSGVAWATVHGLNLGPAVAQFLVSHGLGFIQQLVVSDTFNIFEPAPLAMLVMGAIGVRAVNIMEARRVEVVRHLARCKDALSPQAAADDAPADVTPAPATPADPPGPRSYTAEELSRLLSSLVLPGLARA